MSRKIDEYMSNPDEFSVDEDNVGELIEQMGQLATGESEGGTTDSVATEEGAQAAGDTTPDETADATPETGAADDEGRKVIKTRDGKHEIPYSVLEQERRDKVEAQRQLAELQRQLAERSQHQPAEAAHQEEQTPGASADTDEFDLEFFREEFGDEAAEAERQRREKYAALEARHAALEKEIEANRQWRESQETRRQQSVESEINEAIDSLPELREWRDKQDPLWDAAVALDNRLMNDPAYADISYRERFTAVLERLTGRTAAPKQPTQQDAQEALDKRLRESDDSPGIPSSLSDLPGGHIPDQSEMESLERMSVTQLESKMASMTPEQQQAFLARL